MDARELAKVTVLGLDGERVHLGSLWRDRPAVLVWLRHYGCLFCIEQTREMRKAHPAIKAAGASLVLIGNGGDAAARQFHDEHARGLTLLTDPELASYRAIGARSGVASTIGPRAWGSGLRALRKGARQSAVKGHPFQQGATMVIAPPDRVVFSHISQAAGDHADVTGVLEALRTLPTSKAS